MEEKPYKPRFGRPPKVPSTIPLATDNGHAAAPGHASTATSASVKQEVSSPATSGTAPFNSSTSGPLASSQAQTAGTTPSASAVPSYKGPKWKWKQQSSDHHRQQQEQERKAREEAEQRQRQQEQQPQQLPQPAAPADARVEPSSQQKESQQPVEAVTHMPRDDRQEAENQTAQAAATVSTTATAIQPVAGGGVAAAAAAAAASTAVTNEAVESVAQKQVGKQQAQQDTQQQPQQQQQQEQQQVQSHQGQQQAGQQPQQQQVGTGEDKDRLKESARRDREDKDKVTHDGKQQEVKKPRKPHSTGGAPRTTPAPARRATNDMADDEEDMFVTLPSVAIKQQPEEKGPTLARKGSSKVGLGAAHRSSAGGAIDGSEQVSKASKAGQGAKVLDSGEQVKPLKPSKRGREETQRDSVLGVSPDEGAGEAAAAAVKKARAADVNREGSEPSTGSIPKLQAHNSLTGSTGKIEALAAVNTTVAPSDVRDQKETASKPEKEAGSKRAADTAAAAQPGGSKPAKKQRVDQGTGKGKARNIEEAAQGAKRGKKGDTAGSPGIDRLPLKRGPSIVVVKPLDNSSQDPASRKPPVVQSGELTLPAVHPLPVVPASTGAGNVPGRAKKGAAAKTGEKEMQPAQVVDIVATALKREGSSVGMAAAAAAGAGATALASKAVADVAGKTAGHGKDKSGAASPAAAEKGKQGEKGASGVGKQKGEKRDRSEKAGMKSEKAAGEGGMQKGGKDADAAHKAKVKQEQKEDSTLNVPVQAQPTPIEPASPAAAPPPSVTQTQGAADGLTDSGVKQEEHFVDCILECGQNSCASGVAGLTLPPGLAALLCQALNRANGGAVESGSVQSIMKAKVDLSKTRSAKELWAQLSQVFKPDVLPDRLQAQLVYMDGDGDWMLVMPDDSWATVAMSARKLLIAHKA